jgi:hypothetical protein
MKTGTSLCSDDLTALEEIAFLVRAGDAITPDLQKRANAAIERAISTQKWPTKIRGRPQTVSQSLKAAAITLLQQDRMYADKAKEDATDRTEIQRRAVERAVKKHGSKLVEAFERLRALPSDEFNKRVRKDSYEEAFRQVILELRPVCSLDEFDDLTISHEAEVTPSQKNASKNRLICRMSGVGWQTSIIRTTPG